MSPKRLEWKVGLFVLVCLVLLGVLVLNFSKGLTFFTPTYTLHLKTANVGGIKREASVLMAGVQVGNFRGRRTDEVVVPRGVVELDHRQRGAAHAGTCSQQRGDREQTTRQARMMK